MRYALIALLGLGAVLVYLLSAASANTAFFARNYPVLLAVNGVFGLALATLVVYQVGALRRERRAGVFGAKLTWRLVRQYALVAVLPGVVVYGVSVLFLSKSIESWFDVRVDKALEGGLNLGRSALDYQLRELAKKGESMSQALAERPSAEHVSALNALREQVAVDEAALFDLRGNLIAFSGSDPVTLVPRLPGPAALQQVRQQQSYAALDATSDRGLLLHVVVPVNVLTLAEPVRALQLVQQVPREMARDAETVEAVYQDYRELSLSRTGLRYLYSLTLTLTLLVALLSALAVGVLLSRRMASPLAVLQAGTQAVAQGDFSQRGAVKSLDELGALIGSFNAMTRQLDEAREAAERNRAQRETAHAYINGVLANLSAGVLAFDRDFRLVTSNASAGDILGVDLADCSGQAPEAWSCGEPLARFAAAVRSELDRAGAQPWEVQLAYAGKGSAQTLLVRGTRLAGGEAGFAVVFDDVTHLIQAQRDAAWAEVARRLAHEIKNPLTPIQLSAERLRHKLADKLPASEAEMLARSTQTIVNQVAAMKSMVDAFADYARPRKPGVERLDLNALVREVLRLYESSAVHPAARLSEPPAVVLGDPTQLRQVLHNLLQNAQDSLAGAEAPAEVEVSTAVGPESVQLAVRDNGPGFPEALISRAFEPYVTTKPKGTGLGLAIVKKIVEEHGGVIQIANSVPHGAVVTIRLPRAEEDAAAAAGG